MTLSHSMPMVVLLSCEYSSSCCIVQGCTRIPRAFKFQPVHPSSHKLSRVHVFYSPFSHKPDRFANEIMPIYFKHTRVSSFQRQLNLYGFTRINSGPNTGGYYHELFLRGRPAFCTYIRRVGAARNGATPRVRGVKPHNAVVDPDFERIPPIGIPRSNV